MNGILRVAPFHAQQSEPHGNQAEIYGFDNDQNELLAELLGDKYGQYFVFLITGLRYLEMVR
jgi:hypothetical protein